MSMENYIILAILAAIIGCIVFYLVRAKKKGQACVGCPYAKNCSGKCRQEPRHCEEQGDVAIRNTK